MSDTTVEKNLSTSVKPKPGYKTTEFWVGLVIPQILALLVLFGVFTQDQSTALSNAISQIVGGVISAISAFGYQVSRGKAKSKN